MNIIGRDQMQGFLENLDHSDLGSRGLNRIRAVVDHYFTCQIFPDLPKDVGYKYSENLMDFIRMAVLTDKTFEAMVDAKGREGESR